MADKPSEELKGVTTGQETPEEKHPEIPNSPFGRIPATVALSASILIGTAAAIYAVQNFNIGRLDFSSLAELLPHEASTPADSAIVTVLLTDIRSSQKETETTLRENSSALQQNTGALQQSAVAVEAIQKGFTAQQTDLKKISSQLSSLIGRMDSLQNSVAPLTTSSIPQRSGRARMTRKKMSRLPKPFGPVSVGGAPLSIAPASVPVEERLPNG